MNHSVESGVPPKSRFGGQGATPRPDSKYTECHESWQNDICSFRAMNVGLPESFKLKGFNIYTRNIPVTITT